MDIATSPAPQPSLPAWSAQEFEAQLRDKGAAYHIHHPFNVRMNAGGCTADELRCWVANRFYYQICIPRKDAAILANMPDRAHRRLWVLGVLVGRAVENIGPRGDRLRSESLRSKIRWHLGRDRVRQIVRHRDALC